MKILIVDDVGLIRKQVEHLLTQHGGYAVETAGCAKVALQQLRQDGTIDIILTDLLMPEMNGLEFVKEAQSIERIDDNGTVSPPSFILLTGVSPRPSPLDSVIDDDKQLLQQAIKSCLFADVIYKPIKREELLSRIAELREKTTVSAQWTLDAKPTLQPVPRSLNTSSGVPHQS